MTAAKEEDVFSRLLSDAGAALRDKRYEDTEELLRRAMLADVTRPETFNVLGVLMEIRRDRLQAQRFYRAALALDPAYRPARNNLDRLVGIRKIKTWDLGEEDR